MERCFNTNIGTFRVQNVNGTIHRYTLFASEKSVIIAPSNGLALSVLETEMSNYSTAINRGCVFGTDAAEISPLPGRKGVTLVRLLYNIIKIGIYVNLEHAYLFIKRL